MTDWINRRLPHATLAAVRRAAGLLTQAPRRVAALCLLAVVLASPSAARAEDEEKQEGRFEGYAVKDDQGRPAPISVALEKSGTGGTWVVFIIVTVMSCAVLFKNAKRSHLD